MENRQIEIPTYNNIVTTSRSLDPNHSSNSNITVSLTQKQYDEMITALHEVYIRFDTNPNYYQREDYKKLIDTIAEGFTYLYTYEFPEIVTQWNTVLSDAKIPSEKLVKETIDILNNSLNTEITLRTNADSVLQTNINTEIQNRTSADEVLRISINAEKTAREITDATLQAAINSEVNNRIQAITDEAQLRSNGDSGLQTAINSEVTARTQAVSSEATVRANADTQLETKITTLELTSLNTEDYNLVTEFVHLDSLEVYDALDTE